MMATLESSATLTWDYFRVPRHPTTIARTCRRELKGAGKKQAVRAPQGEWIHQKAVNQILHRGLGAGGVSLLQSRVLSIGFLQHWDVRVCVFPPLEEVLVRFPGLCCVTRKCEAAG